MCVLSQLFSLPGSRGVQGQMLAAAGPPKPRAASDLGGMCLSEIPHPPESTHRNRHSHLLWLNSYGLEFVHV